jgi:hypothetical protein
VSTYYRNKLVLLHELAHCLRPGGAAHGREYARVYLLLVTRVLGRAAGKALRDAFVAHGVKYRKVTATQRSAGRRLAATRGDGGAALARYRETQAAERARKEAAGMVKVGTHWIYPAPDSDTEMLTTRAAARAEYMSERPATECSAFGPYLPE